MTRPTEAGSEAARDPGFIGGLLGKRCCSSSLDPVDVFVALDISTSFVGASRGVVFGMVLDSSGYRAKRSANSNTSTEVGVTPDWLGVLLATVY